MYSENETVQYTLANWVNGQRKERETTGRKQIDIWIDGACEPVNPGGTGCVGYVIKSDETTIAKHSCIIGKGVGMTSNVAEYTALIYALQKVNQLGLQNEHLTIKSDSQLLVNQMNRKWKVKAPLIVPLHKSASKLVRDLNHRIVWIPREENEEADRLTRFAYEKSLK